VVPSQQCINRAILQLVDFGAVAVGLAVQPEKTTTDATDHQPKGAVCCWFPTKGGIMDHTNLSGSKSRPARRSRPTKAGGRSLTVPKRRHFSHSAQATFQVVGGGMLFNNCH